MYHDSTNHADNLQITSTLTGSVHTTVNALREAFAISQNNEFPLERQARGFFE